MNKAEKVVAQLLETPMRGEQNRIKCKHGWIFWSRRADGRYYVTASGQRAMTIDHATFNHVIHELVRELGGRSGA